MGLFTFHRLGKIKSNQKASLRESRYQTLLQKEKDKELANIKQKQLNMEKRNLEIKRDNEKRDKIGKIRIRLYDYFKKIGLTNININLGADTSISADSSHNDKNYFNSAYNNISNLLYFIGGYIMSQHISLSSNGKPYLYNDGKSTIYGQANIKQYITIKKQQEHEFHVKEAKRRAKIEAQKAHTRGIICRICTIIIAFCIPYGSFIYYLVRLIRHTNDSSHWSRVQIYWILGLSLLWTVLLFILGL